jgi:hypothetical protein
VPQAAFGVDALACRHMEVQHQQGHGDGENTVAERGETLHILTGNTVVKRVHLKEFSIGKKSRRQSEDCERFAESVKHQRSKSRRRRPAAMRLLSGCFWLAIAAWALALPAARAQEPQQSPSTQSSPAQNSEGSSQRPTEQKNAEQLPQNPKPQQENSGNPVQAAGDVTKQFAESSFKKARDWESGWIAGIYVGKNRKLVPLTAHQREDYYLHQTLTTPEAYMKRAFAALIDQARGMPAWQGGIGGYAERFASREGQFITANSLAALGNAKLGYEVRYDKCKCPDFKHRFRHAIIRNFLTYDRSEANLRPQWALYGGAVAGGLLATTWKPSNQSYLRNAGWAVLGQAGFGSLLNLITEFSTEINRKQGVVR